MIINTEGIKNNRYLVVGAARSGMAAAEFLLNFGAEVIVTDQKKEKELGGHVDFLRKKGAVLSFGDHDVDYFTSVDCVVVSPGVPLIISPLTKARNAGIPVISEIELAFRHTDASVIGITGSNGKTTTTALTGHILQHAKYKCRVCGNIGTPFIRELYEYPDTEYFVIELSSFQLESIDTFHPLAASVLNITPDHLDRYKSVEEYAKAKFNVFRNQAPGDFAVLNEDDQISQRLASSLNSRIRTFSSCSAVKDGLFLKDGKICMAKEQNSFAIVKEEFLELKGKHNLENFMAAALLASAVGIDIKTSVEAARGFKSIEHRLEYVTTIDGVAYYNDSKATNVDAAVKSLESFEGNLVLILGGRDKGGDFVSMGSIVRNKVKHLVVTGEASQKIIDQLGSVVPHIVEERFDEAVHSAMAIAEKGDVVLLAPACASFDEFKNFEERGRRFKDLVLTRQREKNHG